MTEEQRPLLEEVLDYALYAPVGLVLSVTEDLPALVRKGRARIEGQLTIARYLGRIAAGRARRRIDEYLETTPEPPPQSVARVPETIAPETRPPLSVVRDAPRLAIPDYDALAASQVVARLSGLRADELAEVRRHEEATRRRRTILNRIAQLEQQSGASGS